MSPEKQRIALAEIGGWRKWKFGDPWVKGLKLADKQFNGYVRQVIWPAPSASKTVKLNVDEAWTFDVAEVRRDFTPLSHWTSSSGAVRRCPPSYLNNITAIHALILGLPLTTQTEIAAQLRTEFWCNPNTAIEAYRRAMLVTAPKLCEVTLRALGK